MSAAPKIVPAAPQAWRQGFLNLRPSVVPCLGLGLGLTQQAGQVFMRSASTSWTVGRIAFVNTAHYRDTPGRPTGAVPIWLFGR
ncbi:hypothetical protein [Methylobacterium sp. J-090]|uniref:hypothetical protein n=1 Tax=Methylobacterium sp. J-090 TaxID=2836666 RepID=UPI001FB98132|nr:hypothetical protein [Methylobacterium sp. J-090]MCJ2082750.1 hypothetical protein [Methylobacterium sp. J-090]